MTIDGVTPEAVEDLESQPTETCPRALHLYWFSGTGNAKAAAMWVAATARDMGVEVTLHSMARLEGMEIPAPSEGALVGLFYPTHGFNAPPVVLSFIRRFPRTSRNDLFLVNTRAGMKLFCLVTPGLSGIAQYLPALMMRMKGYRPVGWRPLDLPSNWISVHPALRGKAVDHLFRRCRVTMERFTRKVLSGKKAMRGLIDLPFDLVISPIAILYYIYGRFALAKTFVASAACDDCGRCMNQCPVKAIEKRAGRLFWRYNCESCMQCMNICHVKAIHTAHGFALFIWWLVFSLLPAWLTGSLLEGYVHGWFGQSPSVDGSFVIVMALVSMFCLFGSYWLLHILMKWTPFNRIIEWTSLTRLPFWGRYKAPGWASGE